jgi:hypothetical protein
MSTYIKTYLFAGLVLLQTINLLGTNASATPATDTPACPADLKQSAADAAAQPTTSNETDAKRRWNEPVPVYNPKEPGSYNLSLKFWFYRKWVTENHCSGNQCHSHCKYEGANCIGSTECHMHCTDECLTVQTMSSCFAACKHMKQRALHNFVVNFKDNNYLNVAPGFGRVILDPFPWQVAPTIKAHIEDHLAHNTQLPKELSEIVALYLPEAAIEITLSTSRNLSYLCTYNLETGRLVIKRKTTYRWEPRYRTSNLSGLQLEGHHQVVDKVEDGAGNPIPPDQE